MIDKVAEVIANFIKAEKLVNQKAEELSKLREAYHQLLGAKDVVCQMFVDQNDNFDNIQQMLDQNHDGLKNKVETLLEAK